MINEKNGTLNGSNERENMIVDMVERRDNSKGWVTLKIDK